MARDEMLYGLLAEFDSPEALIEAIRHARASGYRNMDAFSPFPLEELSEAMELPKSRIPAAVLLGGILGGSTGFLMQWYATAVDYPINVGGRPLNSWPVYIPITFELTILTAAIFGLLALLFACRLPLFYHPVFNAPRFPRALQDGYFLCIEADDPRFDREKIASLLREWGAAEVTEVPKR